MTCYTNENMSLCTPGKLKRKVFGRTNKRWCFKCRGRFIHDKVIYTEILKYTPEGELINGWYEPIGAYECRNCGEEHLEFAS